MIVDARRFHLVTLREEPPATLKPVGVYKRNKRIKTVILRHVAYDHDKFNAGRPANVL
jgi:hypothetical protein